MAEEENPWGPDLKAFVERLKGFFPEKDEDQYEKVISPISTDPHYFSDPKTLALLLQQKWNLKLDQAIIYASRLAPLISLNRGGDTPPMMRDMNDPLKQFVNMMMTKALYSDFLGDKSDKGDKGTMDMKTIMEYGMMSKMFGGEGGDASRQLQHALYEMKDSMKDSISNLERRIDSIESGGKGIRFMNIPDEEGKPKRIAVATESEVLDHLMLMMSRDSSQDDKLYDVLKMFVEKSLPSGEKSDSSTIKDIYDRMIDLQKDRVEDIKSMSNQKGDLEGLIGGVDKMEKLGFKLAPMGLDDQVKLMEQQMKILDKRFDIWNKEKDRESRDQMWSSLVGKIGEGIDNVTNKYSDDIKEWMKKAPDYFKQEKEPKKEPKPSSS